MHDKDFYILDNTILGYFESVDDIILFIKRIMDGFSCVSFARRCVAIILQSERMQNTIKLFDGDKTVSEKDTSHLIFGYRTNVFDNNFYTGYQSWLHTRNFLEKYSDSNRTGEITRIIGLHRLVTNRMDSHSYILTSGSGTVWKALAKRLAVKCFYGEEMSADAKYFIAKFLKQAYKRIEAYGDGMNDYFLLKEADSGFLIANSDGKISRSLINVDIGGIRIVRIRKDM